MQRRYSFFALASVLATYLVIFAGSLVRASGAGMGCPDWPRCFDRWIPPTEISQVPPQFAQWFSVQLAWIEYLNRLVGAVLGVLVLGAVVTAVLAHRKQARVLYPTIAGFFFVGLAGWLGKRVVEQNLDPAFVTVHMFVALAVVASLLYAVVNARLPLDPSVVPSIERGSMRMGSVALAAVIVIQIALGTRVRALIEHVAFGPQAPLSSGHARPAVAQLARGEWLSRVGSMDGIHRTMALVVVAGAIALAIYVRRTERDRVLRVLSLTIAGLCVSQLLAGVGLAYLALPPVLQVFHVTVGCLIFGAILVFSWLTVRIEERDEPVASE
ncbi:MAG: COX15/CtaA family protein [Deltaproteobacteria bacterium]|nr:COX15/CtaA family protein [Deltaproteobacteria bacterium]